MEGSGVLYHFSHDHPLSLTQTQSEDICVCCWKPFYRQEAAYSCSIKDCGHKKLMHQECAEMPRWITHPKHTHKLKQRHFGALPLERGKCSVCDRYIFGMGYYCNDGCVFQLHLGCASYAADTTDRHGLEHPSHPQHRLQQLNRRHSFRCDACGTTGNETNKSYICSICQYWIHDRCAEAPTDLNTEDHQHTLSLAYGLPEKYLKSDRRCGICMNELLLRYWVYYCGSCSFLVHIKCVIKERKLKRRKLAGGEYGFSITDISSGLIRPFVGRERGELLFLFQDFKNVKCQFHHHQLSLLSDDDDNNDNHIGRSELICDGCTTPIPKNHKYMGCGDCKYFLHLSCSQLPPELPYHPLHQPNHKMVLQACPKDMTSEVVVCDICLLSTNGFFYACAECDCSFEIDIKCASMPHNINHKSHPREYHNLNLLVTDDVRFQEPWVTDDELFKDPSVTDDERFHCCGCGYVDSAFYRCDSCRFILCFRCASLPQRIEHRWDDHMLWLRYDHSDQENHPDPFYCEVCEQEMDPELWMYHCRECDQSFHPDCIPTEAGDYRNIKFGQQYAVATCHDHPLSYQLITIKLRCDLCRDESVFGRPGFYCELCDFVMCFDRCGIKHIQASK